MDGRVTAGFEPVAEAFAAVVAAQPDAGAAVAVRVRGGAVVDLWGGVANARAGRDWVESTPSVVFSSTKGLMAILAAQLVAEARLDYEAPVAEYWPEFAQNGKANVLVRHVLAHRAGLPAFDGPVTGADLADWSGMADRLARQAPIWEPGAAHAYHPLSWGWLVGEVLRRVSGLEPGALLRRRLADPLEVDAWLGVSGEVGDRVAELQDPPELLPMSPNAPEWVGRTATGPVSLAVLANDPTIRAAQLPAAGGIATASALATIWSAVVTRTSGIRLLDDDVLRTALQVQSAGPQVDGSLPPHARWGMGFQLDSDARHYLTPDAFGHDGFGGQVTFADPTHEVGFAFITNRLLEVGDARASSLIDALRQCVEPTTAADPRGRRSASPRPSHNSSTPDEGVAPWA